MKRHNYIIEYPGVYSDRIYYAQQTIFGTFTGESLYDNIPVDVGIMTVEEALDNSKYLKKDRAIGILVDKIRTEKDK